MHAKSRAGVAMAALSVLAVGCGFCQSPADDPESKVPGKCSALEPAIDPQKLDILFVIDNSNSMREEQEGVARELTAFVDEVKKGGGVDQDFRVGVVTTSVYLHRPGPTGGFIVQDYPLQAGKLQAVPDMGADGGVQLGTGTERVLVGTDPQLVDKFSRLVKVGTFGSGQETPLEAARLALLDPKVAGVPLENGGNGGFLRDRARLLVVVVTDEDDCSEINRPPVVYVSTDVSIDYCTQQGNSLTPVSEYHRLFTQDLLDATGAHRELVFAVIGPVAQSNKAAQGVFDGQWRNIDCPTSFEPGHRIRKVAEMFDPTLANLDSICKSSYRDTLVAIAGLANISQTLEVRNVPDPRLLQITIIRRDGRADLCTMSSSPPGLIGFDPPNGDQPSRVHFGNHCLRRADDKEVQIKMLCAG